jgi:hypothetical protein
MDWALLALWGREGLAPRTFAVKELDQQVCDFSGGQILSGYVANQRIRF